MAKFLKTSDTLSLTIAAYADGSSQAASFELGLALEKHGEWRSRHVTSSFWIFTNSTHGI